MAVPMENGRADLPTGLDLRGSFKKEVPVTGPAARVSRETNAEEGSGGDGKHGANWGIQSRADQQTAVECEPGRDGTNAIERHGTSGQGVGPAQADRGGDIPRLLLRPGGKTAPGDAGAAQRTGPLDADLTPNIWQRQAGMDYVYLQVLATSSGKLRIHSIAEYAESEQVMNGGETEIRTLDTLRYTRFPSVRLKPLGHLSAVVRTV